MRCYNVVNTLRSTVYINVDPLSWGVVVSLNGETGCWGFSLQVACIELSVFRWSK